MELHHPVIVSQDRFKDLEPYISFIYNRDYVKWRNVFPWEFPQNASKEAEEAFIDHVFSPQEARIQGYRFLKQVFYCIAIWNAEIKLPMIAQWWINHNRTLLADPNTHEYIHHKDTQAKTFFSGKDLELYGKKMLDHVVIYLQHTFKASSQPQSTDASSVIPGAQNAILNVLPEDTTSVANAANTQASLSSKQRKAASTARVPSGHEMNARPRAESVSAAHVLPIQNRKRGNTYTQPNDSHNLSMRYNSQHGVSSNGTTQDLSQFAQLPAFGFVPEYPQPHLHPRVAPAPAAAYPQTVPNSIQRPHREFMPPMQAIQKHSGMQYVNGPYLQHTSQIVFHERMPREFISATGQQAHGGYKQEAISNHNHRPTDKRGGNNEGYSPFEVGAQPHGPRQRRDSNASQSGKGRVSASCRHYKSNRARNSFDHRHPSSNLAGGPKWTPRAPDSLSGPSNDHDRLTNRRYACTAERNWRSASERHQAPFSENKPPRGFSVPETYTQTANVQPRSQLMQFLQPLPAGRIIYARPTDVMVSSDFGLYSAYVPPSEQRPILHPSELDHDAPDPAKALRPERVLTRDHVGRDCTHVRKLVIFGVDRKIDDKQVLAFFRQFGPNVRICRAGYVGGQSDFFWVYYDNHSSVIEALRFRGDHRLGNHFRIEVPREYWQPDHRSYPGDGHPAAPPRGDRLMGGPSSGEQYISSVGPPMSKLTQEIRSQEEFVPSGPHDEVAPEELQSTPPTTTATPTASATNTPNKENKKRSKTKLLRESTRQQRSAQQREHPNNRNSATSPSETPETGKLPDSPAKSSTELQIASPEAEAAAAVLPLEDISKAEHVTEAPAPNGSLEEEQALKGGVEITKDQPFLASEKDEKEAAGSASYTLTITSSEIAVGAIAESAPTTATVSISEFGRFPYPLPPNVDDEQADDSFHTANGTPEGQRPSRRALERGSDESTSTVITAAGPLEAEIVLPIEEVNTDIVVASTPLVPNNDEAKLPKVPEGPTVPEDTANSVVHPSRTTNSSSETSKPLRKAATVALPKIKISEAPSRRASDTVKGHRSGSNTSVPLTPAFVTATTMPAVPIVLAVASINSQNEAYSTEQKDASSPVQDAASMTAQNVSSSLSLFQASLTVQNHGETRDTAQSPAQLPVARENSVGRVDDPQETPTTANCASDPVSKPITQKQTRNPEKAKGPAQTESLLGGLFSKPQKQKVKKLKAQKGKGSMNGRPKLNDEQDPGEGEDSQNRVLGGTSLPPILNRKRSGTAATKGSAINDIEEGRPERLQGTLQPSDGGYQPPVDLVEKAVVPASSRDASPSKSRRFFHSITDILYSKQLSQASTPDSAREPVSHQSVSAAKQPISPLEATLGAILSQTDSPPKPIFLVSSSNSIGGKVPPDKSSFRQFTDGQSGKQMEKAGTSGSKTQSPGWKAQMVDSGYALPGGHDPLRLSRLAVEIVNDAALGADGDDGDRFTSGVGIGLSNAATDSVDVGMTESSKSAKKKKKKSEKRKNKANSAHSQGHVESPGLVMVPPSLIEETVPQNSPAQDESNVIGSALTIVAGAKITVCAQEDANIFSRAQTPASSPTTSLDSPSRLEKLQRQVDSHLLTAPGRPRGHHKLKRRSSARNEGTKKPEEMVRIRPTEETGGGECGEQGIVTNKCDATTHTIQKRAMTAQPPFLYLILPTTATRAGRQNTTVEELGEDEESPKAMKKEESSDGVLETGEVVLGGYLEAKGHEPENLRKENVTPSS